MTDMNHAKSGATPFKPRARLVSVLGEQLIRDATVGIIELVKNGYDADADYVRVELLNLAHPERTIIAVRDNGFGMTLETVLDKWFEPASGHKEAQKKADQRTSRGRLPLGEKGVGRFAAQKLGKELKMITRASDEAEEVVVEIDWTGFEQEGAYLDSIPMRWHLRAPETFIGQQSGTRLEMVGARSKWTEGDVAKVASNLKRLMSPFRTPDAFRVQLKCPEYRQYEDLNPGDLLKQAHATFVAVIDDYGRVEYDYEFKLPGYEKRSSSLKSEDEGSDLRTTIKKGWDDPKRKPSCGAFYLNFYLWDRRPESLRLTGTSTSELNESVGVSIFRDGIRVLPYGDPNDDWLELDKQRYMKSSEAISRKNIVGAVEISQTLNRQLKDKTNREGLIENDAYSDFVALLKSVLQIVQNEFSEDRAKIDKQKRAPSTKLRPSFERLDSSIKNLADVSRPLQESAQRLSASIRDGTPIGQSDVDSLTEFVQKTTDALTGVKSAQKMAERAVDDSLEDFASERDLLLGLSGLGLAAERFTHEFSRLTREAGEALQRIRKKLGSREPEATKDIDSLEAVIDALQNDIRSLGPLFYVRRMTREKELDLKKVVNNALMLNDSQVKDNRIEVEVIEKSPLKVTMREGPCTQVFNNLIDNACHWLGRTGDQEDRKLRVVINGIAGTVLVSNNGPSVPSKFRHRIFEPFFTTKAEGRGLGLYITQEILAEKKAVILLLEEDDHPDVFPSGVSFLVRFAQSEAEKERPGNEA
jgi:signal transduction histidine kinase